MTHETTAQRILAALAPHGLKTAGPNEYRCNSPLRPGSNSGALSLHLDADGEHGAWHDHVSGENGSLYELAARLSIEVPKTQAQDTKRRYAGLADYAAAHYAPAEAFVAAGWAEGTHKNRQALIYKVGGKQRYRFIDGNPPAYEWEKGGKPAWYGLKRAIATVSGRALILCNGEASTIAAQHHGLPACAWAGGEQKLPDAAIAELKAAYTGSVVLAYDCDSTGERVAQEVAAQLDAAGFAVRVAALGMTTHGDLADFAGLYRETAWAELDKRAPAYLPNPAQVESDLRALEVEVKAATTPPEDVLAAKAQALGARLERLTAAIAPPRVLELHDLANDVLSPNTDARRWTAAPIPELAALIGPFSPELYVIYGAANMGKSWLAATLAGALIFGGAGAGLIISTEMSPRAFFERVVSYRSRVPLSNYLSSTVTDEERHAWRAVAAHASTFSSRFMDMSSPSPMSVVKEAERAAADIGLNWLIVDSATRMAGSGEGIYERMTSISNGLQNLARDFHIPVIATSQVGRDVADRSPGKRQPRLDDAYGSSVIEQNAGVIVGLYDHAYYVTKELEAPDDATYPPGTARLTLLKHRSRAIPDTPHCTARYEKGCGFYPYTRKAVQS